MIKLCPIFGDTCMHINIWHWMSIGDYFPQFIKYIIIGANFLVPYGHGTARALAWAWARVHWHWNEWHENSIVSTEQNYTNVPPTHTHAHYNIRTTQNTCTCMNLHMHPPTVTYTQNTHIFALAQAWTPRPDSPGCTQISQQSVQPLPLTRPAGRPWASLPKHVHIHVHP